MTTRVRSSKDQYSVDGAMSRRVMTDTRTPNFKALVNAGILICNPAESFSETFHAKVNHGFTGTVTRNGKIISTYSPKSLQSAVWRPSSSQWANGQRTPALIAALTTNEGQFVGDEEIGMRHTELSSRLAEGIQSILVSFAERDKTKGMILRAINLLRHPIRDAWRYFAKLRPRQRLQKIEEMWLEGRYGWRPFVLDVQDAVEAHQAKVGDRLSKKGIIPGWETTVEYPQGTIAWNNLVLALTQVAKYQGYVRVGQTGDFRAGMMQGARAYGLYDLVGTGWDLIPYSFVVDWFCNIGQAAKAMQAYALLDERIGWTTYERLVTSNIRCTIQRGGPIWVDPYTRVDMVDPYVLGDTPHYSTKSWTRVPRTSFLPVIGSRIKLDWAKVVDAAALLDQAFSRCFGSRR